MTVLAAYRVHGVPLLIGDVVTTAPGRKGLRKKIYLVSPSLVVGWTGHLIAAREIITHIHKTFYGRQVEKRVFEYFLKTYDVAQFGECEVRLVGWLYDCEPHCFLWQSSYPSEVFYSESYFEGTGEKYFEKLTSPTWATVKGGSTGESPDEPSEEYLAIYEALTATGEAFFSELLFPNEWEQTFGFAYEVLAFNEGSFRAVHTVSHLGWDYDWDSSTKAGVPKLSSFAARYIHNGNHSIIQKVIHKDLRVVKLNNYLVKPVYEGLPDIAPSGIEFSFFSDFYVHYIVLRPYLEHPFRLCFVTGTGEPRQPIWVEAQDGRPFVGVDSSYIDEIFREAGA